MAIGDIVEPVEEWRNYKFEQTKQKWDYVFRILYYTASPDLTNTPFSTPLEIANVDATAGHITNHDLWISPDGSAYILYSEREVSSALIRDKFFPDKTLHNSLKLAIVKGGAIVARHTLVQGSDTLDGGHALSRGGGWPPVCRGLYRRRRHGQLPDAHLSEARAGVEGQIPLNAPFGSFFLAGVRGGTLPSNTIDIFGHAKSGEVLSYAQVALN